MVGEEGYLFAHIHHLGVVHKIRQIKDRVSGGDPYTIYDAEQEAVREIITRCKSGDQPRADDEDEQPASGLDAKRYQRDRAKGHRQAEKGKRKDQFAVSKPKSFKDEVTSEY